MKKTLIALSAAVALLAATVGTTAASAVEARGGSSWGSTLILDIDSHTSILDID